MVGAIPTPSLPRGGVASARMRWAAFGVHLRWNDKFHSTLGDPLGLCSVGPGAMFSERAASSVGAIEPPQENRAPRVPSPLSSYRPLESGV